ncbi:MAG TPA: diadenylate cyclase CdaA [Syntrophorhabdaceae bacterium]|mgnify:CR=1 FL=1|nr:diadenylate cyclase CdaA [Syntrophorhabdaceae bacterium]
MIYNIRWQDIIDILIVSFIIYRILVFIKGTRSIQLIVGLIIILFVFYVSKKLELFTLNWILGNFVGSLIIIVVVIFQDDIRRMLLALGRSPFLRRITYLEESLFYDNIVNACVIMSKRKIGALIVIERDVGLEEFMEIGIRLDAEVNTELLLSIFHTSSPLHDGATIIREGRIRAAGCILPLTQREDIDKTFGTRHRAAIGISEITDAVTIVVSEESGNISYTYKGDIYTKLNGETLKVALKDLLRKRK